MRILSKKKPEAPLKVGGKAHWRAGEVVVMQALTDTDVENAQDLRNKGMSDTRIWRALRPEDRPDMSVSQCGKTGEFKLKLEQLTKAQLVMIIEATTSAPMSSLQQMKREDLIKLIRNFRAPAKPQVTMSP